jgi:hypothetical protein
MRADPQTVAIGTAGALVTVAFGALAGSTIGPAAGALAALGGLAGTAAAAVVQERQARDSVRAKRKQELLEMFAFPRSLYSEEDEESSPGEQPSLSVACFLRAEEEVVPFWARPELDELLAWCGAGAHVGVRLVTGEGGAGKTRLLLQLCGQLAANGWQPLWVHQGAEAYAAEAVRELGPCVLVVDYAETRDGLGAMLSEVAAITSAADVRVVVLARRVGEWWQRLISSSADRVARLLEEPPVTLREITINGGPSVLFDEALTAFANKLQITRPDTPLMLTDAEPTVLEVHAAALLAILDHAEGSDITKPRSAADVLDGLLAHEGRYWAQSASARGLDLDVATQHLAVAVACLIGAHNESAAAELMRRVPELVGSAERRGKVARWLHDLYPSTHRPDTHELGEWLSSLRPDRLAEQLVTGELTRRPELIPLLFSGLDQGRATRALTVLARAGYIQPAATDQMRKALEADPGRLIYPALTVATNTNPGIASLIMGLLGSNMIPASELASVAAAIPHPSVALAEVGEAVSAALAATAGTADERARWLGLYSTRLSELRRREEALAAVEDAVMLYRWLTAAHREAFLPNLALSLSNKANRLWAVGRADEALVASEEAVATYRDLAEARPDLYRAEYVRSLSGQANILWGLGQREDALAASRQVVTSYKELATARPDEFRPALGEALSNQTNMLLGVGQRDEALAAAEEAVTIRRELAAARPDAFRPALAGALNNLANMLSGVGQREKALVSMQETVDLYRQLAAARPDAFRPALAGALNNLSNRLSGMGRHAEALTAADEAVDIRKELAATAPDAFMPDLAQSLNTQAGRLWDLNRPEEALAALGGAIAHYRELAAAWPEAFRPFLAQSLCKQASMLGLGRTDEALTAVQEAVALYRDLAAAQPGAVAADLAAALSNEATALWSLGRREEALARTEEAVTSYRKLATTWPDAFQPDLARALDSLSYRLLRLGRQKKARSAAEGALAIRSELAATEPDAFRPALAESLAGHADALWGLGQHQEALAAVTEAVALYRELAATEPDAFRLTLARTLADQAQILGLSGRNEEAAVIQAEVLRMTDQGGL